MFIMYLTIRTIVLIDNTIIGTSERMVTKSIKYDK